MLLRSFILLGLCTATLHAQSDPGWWSGVISTDSHALGGNYAPLNLGQLMNLADQARIHLNTEAGAAGGAGPEIESMLASWPDHPASAYSPANLGQLKAIADKFYARLDALGFDYMSQLNRNGYSGSWSGLPDHPRPWDEATSSTTNYATANIGQAKLLFSWDLTDFESGGTDTDGDGLSDAWESAHGLLPGDPDQNHNGIADGQDDFDGDGVSNAQEIIDHTDPFNSADFNSGHAPTAVIDTANSNGLIVWTTLQ